MQDVRIPCQPKRMFGFVTFSTAETAKQILSKGNPHFVCGARVLVKPYREKSKLGERYAFFFVQFSAFWFMPLLDYILGVYIFGCDSTMHPIMAQVVIVLNMRTLHFVIYDCFHPSSCISSHILQRRKYLEKFDHPVYYQSHPADFDPELQTSKTP